MLYINKYWIAKNFDKSSIFNAHLRDPGKPYKQCTRFCFKCFSIFPIRSKDFLEYRIHSCHAVLYISNLPKWFFESFWGSGPILVFSANDLFRKGLAFVKHELFNQAASLKLLSCLSRMYFQKDVFCYDRIASNFSNINFMSRIQVCIWGQKLFKTFEHTSTQRLLLQDINFSTEGTAKVQLVAGSFTVIAAISLRFANWLFRPSSLLFRLVSPTNDWNVSPLKTLFIASIKLRKAIRHFNADKCFP